MRANFIHIEPAIRSVLSMGVRGDMAEFGVWHGTTFLPMAELARLHGRKIHAVDSFVGMAAETERDGGRYREGSHSVGGSAIFRKLVAPFGNVVVHEGYVPEIMVGMTGLQFAFVHLDLDQHAPTLAALRFVWPRMAPGGVVACHDWWRNRTTLAAGAIADFLSETKCCLAGERAESDHGFLVKGSG